MNEVWFLIDILFDVKFIQAGLSWCESLGLSIQNS